MAGGTSDRVAGRQVLHADLALHDLLGLCVAQAQLRAHGGLQPPVLPCCDACTARAAWRLARSVGTHGQQCDWCAASCMCQPASMCPSWQHVQAAVQHTILGEVAWDDADGRLAAGKGPGGKQALHIRMKLQAVQLWQPVQHDIVQLLPEQAAAGTAGGTADAPGWWSLARSRHLWLDACAR